MSGYLCKNLFYNLLSVRKLEEKGCQVVFKNKEVLIMKDDKVIVKGNLFGNLYVVPAALNANNKLDKNMLHRQMGHSSKYPPSDLYEVCLQGK